MFDTKLENTIHAYVLYKLMMTNKNFEKLKNNIEKFILRIN